MSPVSNQDQISRQNCVARLQRILDYSDSQKKVRQQMSDKLLCEDICDYQCVFLVDGIHSECDWKKMHQQINKNRKGIK